MSHSVKIYDTYIGCTQCVRACPTDVLEMIPWDECKARQTASAPRTEDCVGCKRCPKKYILYDIESVFTTNYEF